MRAPSDPAALNAARSWRCVACAVALALALALACPAPGLAEDPSQSPDIQGSFAEAALESGDLTDGTYLFDRFTTSTGMVKTNQDDSPAQAIVFGDEAVLVLDIYNPDKYDGLWAGKREDAPADPLDSSVVTGVMIPAGDYAGDTNFWTDAEGLVGDAGAVYKSTRFFVSMPKRDLIAMFENDGDDDFYFAVRRAPWSPSNPGKWMGSANNYFTLGGLTLTSASTDLPFGAPDGLFNRQDSAVTIDDVKAFIDALPYDPYKVEAADVPSIEEAESAYEMLDASDREQLDVLESACGVLTYGRALQCALWAARALGPVDDTTTLSDGTYTLQVTSTCNMGKSSSRRGYKFTILKVVVSEGRARATLEHETSSPDTVRLGGVVYPHVNEDEKSPSRFEVPIDLNSTFYFSQMAKNPTANTIAIPYEMTTQIDEQNAVPDTVNEAVGNGDDGSKSAEGEGSSVAGAAAETGSASASATDEASASSASSKSSRKNGSSPATTKSSRAKRSNQVGRSNSSGGLSSSSGASSRVRPSSGGSSGVHAASPDGARRTGAPRRAELSLAGETRARKSGAVLGVSDAPSGAKRASGDAPASKAVGGPGGAGESLAPQERAASSMSGDSTPSFSSNDQALDEGLSDAARGHVMPLVVAMLLLTALGAALFAFDYLRRERRFPRMRGVRVPKEQS